MFGAWKMKIDLFDILTSILEVVGIAIIVAGIWLLFGFAVGLIATGIATVFVAYSLSQPPVVQEPK